MGYGLLQTYGLWYAIPREPSWWMDFAMGYKGLWVIRSMGYERFDCIMSDRSRLKRDVDEAQELQIKAGIKVCQSTLCAA